MKAFRTLLLLASALPMLAEPRLLLSKTFPGSRPAYAELRISSDGNVEYREAVDEEPLRLKLSEDETKTVFELARKCDKFRKPLESGLKVARLGEKLFRWEDGAERHEVKFNYTLDESASALLDWYERISESELLLINLERAAKFDPLGVNQAILEIEASWDNKRLVSVSQYLPMLDRVHKNEKYLNMARERAAKLADLFRAAAAPKAAQ